MKIEFEIDEKIIEYLRRAFIGYSFSEPDNNKFAYLLIMDQYVKQKGENNEN